MMRLLVLAALVASLFAASAQPVRADWECYTSYSVVHGWQTWCYDNGGGGGGGFKFMGGPE